MPFDHSLFYEGGERGRATVFTSSLTSCGWSPPPSPCWNTIAEPDTAHSHTVLPHWKSHKTRVIQGSQAKFSFLTGYHTCLGFLTFYRYLFLTVSIFFYKCGLTKQLNIAVHK